MKKISRSKRILKTIYETIKDREEFFRNKVNGAWKCYRIAEYTSISYKAVKKHLAKFRTAQDIKEYLDSNDGDNKLEDIEMQRIYYEGYRTNGNYTIKEYLKACEYVKKHGLKPIIF